MMIYFATFCTVLAAIYAVVEQCRSLILSRKNWDELITELEPTVVDEITVIALEYLNPGQDAFTTHSRSRLASLEGIPGMLRMWKNGRLLIALAGQAERWNPDVSRCLVRQMRQDGSALRLAAFLLCLHLVDHRTGTGALCIQRAAAAYYRMLFRLTEAARQWPPHGAAILGDALWA